VATILEDETGYQSPVVTVFCPAHFAWPELGRVPGTTSGAGSRGAVFGDRLEEMIAGLVDKLGAEEGRNQGTGVPENPKGG